MSNCDCHTAALDFADPGMCRTCGGRIPPNAQERMVGVLARKVNRLERSAAAVASANNGQPAGRTVAGDQLQGLHSLEELAKLVADGVLEHLPVRPEQPEPYMTSTEAADYIRTSPKRISELVSEGRLPAGRDGRKLLLRREDLDKYLAGKHG